MTLSKLLVAPALALALAGCLDLDVENPSEPDRERVTSIPADVEALISSSFRPLFQNMQDDYPNISLAAAGDRITGGFLDFAVLDLAMEPREAWNNSPLYARPDVNADPWYELYEVIANVNDGLRALDKGMRITDSNGADQTPRARAFAKLLQGIAYGYLAMQFDQAQVISERTNLETLDPRALGPYTAVRDSAIAQLDDAIRISEANAFTIPGTLQWVNGVPLSSQELIRLANSYAARILAYTPRTREERAAANWAEILRRAQSGIQQDFAPLGQMDVLHSDYRRLLSRVRTQPGDHIRPDYIVLGPADVSGAYQTWLATPSASRQPFQMNTPDRRIQGAASATARGKYVALSRNTIWAASRGTYRQVFYYYLRLGAGESWHQGPQLTMTVTEMDLLRAEALIRLSRAAEALPLINRSRVANGELPPVTIAGPPDDANCVPRKASRACGSLWDALVYEKGIEMLGIEGAVEYFDARGLGAVEAGTPVHFPVPGRELETLRLDLYTFGGRGPGSAPARNTEQCPVALPRCP